MTNDDFSVKQAVGRLALSTLANAKNPDEGYIIMMDNLTLNGQPLGTWEIIVKRIALPSDGSA